MTTPKDSALSRRRRIIALAAAVATTVPGAAASLPAGAAEPPAGTITTVAGRTVGSRGYGFSGDGGPATRAQLYHPRAIAFAGNGDAYIADTLNARVRRIDASGTITTVAGNGTEGYAGDGGPATRASLNQPHGVAVDAVGRIFIADSSNDRIRMVDRKGIIHTVAGDGTPGAAGDDGPARLAQVKDPKTLAMNADRDVLYIADTGNNRVRTIDLADGTIETIAGVTRAGFDGDGGPAQRAALNSPRGVDVADDGTVYIADTDNQRIRRIGRSGTITTVAGDGTMGYRGDGGRATLAQLKDPRTVAVGPDGALFIGEEAGLRVRRVDEDKVITTIAGNGTAGFYGDGGPAARALVNSVRAVALAENGDLWLADTFNNRVRVITNAASAPVAPPNQPPPPPVDNAPKPPPPPPPPPRRTGYWLMAADAKVFAFGDARQLGDASATIGSAKALHLEPTPSGDGYWILDSAGNVWAFGDASSPRISNPPQLRRGEKVRSLSATPSGEGYWIFTNRGRAFAFGDALHHGDMDGVDLNGPVLGSVSTPSGKGYYMVASDGGVFAFGDARFYGSMGGVALNRPVESLVPASGGDGYWLVASDGGVFAFARAPFRGSMGGTPLNEPVVGMVRFGNGYLMVAADGGIFNFSDRPFSGSMANNPPDKAVVAAATLDAPG